MVCGPTYKAEIDRILHVASAQKFVPSVRESSFTYIHTHHESRPRIYFYLSVRWRGPNMTSREAIKSVLALERVFYYLPGTVYITRKV